MIVRVADTQRKPSTVTRSIGGRTVVVCTTTGMRHPRAALHRKLDGLRERTIETVQPRRRLVTHP
jgi:hypothetical protein